MTVPGIVLSQPDSATTPSNKYPRANSSIESAIISRLISEHFMPSVPIEMPSEIAMVLHSRGTPPAARTPSLILAASRCRCALQGIASVQVLATATSGLLCKSSSLSPAERRDEGAAARRSPSVTVLDRCLRDFKSVFMAIDPTANIYHSLKEWGSNSESRWMRRRRVLRESAQMTTHSPNSDSTCRQAPHGLSAALGATTAIAWNLRCPSLTALPTATRSAQLVSP